MSQNVFGVDDVMRRNPEYDAGFEKSKKELCKFHAETNVVN